MQTEEIVKLLVAERDRLNAAINALDGAPKRRGRPPASKSVYDDPTMPDWVKPASLRTQPQLKKFTRTAAQRKAHAAKMRAYWKKRKAGEAATASK